MEIIKRSHNTLCHNFVTIQNDKASGYTVFYVQVLMKGLNIENQINPYKTYRYLTNINKTVLIIFNSMFILWIFQRKVMKESQYLQSASWTSKLHKEASRSRFIMNVPNCSLELFSKLERHLQINPYASWILQKAKHYFLGYQVHLDKFKRLSGDKFC